MFGSGFSFGFTISDIQTQIAALLTNAVVLGLVAAGIALLWAGRLVRFVKRVGRA